MQVLENYGKTNSSLVQQLLQAGQLRMSLPSAHYKNAYLVNNRFAVTSVHLLTVQATSGH